MLDSIRESQVVKRRGHIINSELIEGEQCHVSCQTVDHFKIAYKTGLWNALYDFLAKDLHLICFP